MNTSMKDSRHLSGRIAWVTGSSRGIGRAIGRALAAAGASVALHGTTPTSIRAFGEGESLEAAAEEMARESGSRVLAFPGDLTDEATVGRLTAEIERQFGRIDILVNCAGGDIGSRGLEAPLAGKPEHNDAVFISLEDLRAVLDRNLLSCILCCRAVAPSMMKRRAGRIINIGSIAGAFGHTGSAIYSTAKAAVHEYTRCLADQLRPYDITVNAVAPGDITSRRYVASRTVDPAMMVESGTLVRYGRPEEVAGVVEFLASAAAGYISGQILRVDGASQLFPI